MSVKLAKSEARVALAHGGDKQQQRCEMFREWYLKELTDAELRIFKGTTSQTRACSSTNESATT